MTDPAYSPRYVRTVVALLVAAVAFEFFHRQLLAIAVEPIRADLGFSDTEMGALATGFAVVVRRLRARARTARGRR